MNEPEPTPTTLAPPSTPSADSTDTTKPPPRRSCRLSGNLLTLAVGTKTTHYRLEEIPSHPLCGRPAYRLTKLLPDGAPSSRAYEVILTQWGPNCDCGDETFRHQNTADHCKHISALRALGKLRSVTGEELSR